MIICGRKENEMENGGSSKEGESEGEEGYGDK